MVPLSITAKAGARALQAALAITLALSGCTSQSRSQSDVALSRAEWRAEIASYPASTFTQDGLQTRYADATILDDSVQHGSQVEYLASDGTAYLWYPGNRRIVVGQWRTHGQDRGETFGSICFRYGANTFNPATNRSGGSWNCVNGGLHIILEDQYTRGDPFQLATRHLPFVLDKDRSYTLENIGTALGTFVKALP